MNDTLNVTVTNPDVMEKAVTTVSNVWGIIPLMFERMYAIVAAPFHHQEMLWLLFHLALTLIVLEFYFGKHHDEELGWAAAVANSLVLFIIAIDLIRHSFHEATPFSVLRTVVLAMFTEETLPLEPQVFLLVLFLAIVGVVATLINYYHLLPRKIAFQVAGHPPINFLAFFAIVIVYTTGTADEIPLDLITLFAGFFVYIILLFIVFLARRAFHSAKHEKKKKH